MFFQKILKGIVGLTRDEAELICLDQGILSNWWRRKGTIINGEIRTELTEATLLHHLNDYDKPLPANHRWSGLGRTYGDVTPFISTTAGAIQRDGYRRTNILFDPFLTALRFATNIYKDEGWIFYAYLVTLGKPSVPLQSFSEEVRELHVYQQFLPYHHEGEITAKVCIPAVCIQKAELYDGNASKSELIAGRKPAPVYTIDNPYYTAPDNYSNIRELL